MKAKLSMIISLLILSLTVLQAQPNFQRRTVEERVEAAMEKIATLNLDQAQKEKTNAVLMDFYKAQDKMREEARASGNRPERSEMEKMSAARDEKLKEIFNEDQYKKFKDEIEATLRPQRRNNGQGAGNI